MELLNELQQKISLSKTKEAACLEKEENEDLTRNVELALLGLIKRTHNTRGYENKPTSCFAAQVGEQAQSMPQ